jgi:hypothetical protein
MGTFDGILALEEYRSKDASKAEKMLSLYFLWILLLYKDGR